MKAPLDVQALIGERVRSLQEYAPEPLEEIARRLGLPVGQLIKLDANENPYGPTRHTLAVMSGYNDYHRYPDPISRRLCRALAEYIQIDASSILVGNGSDELIDVILKLFRPGPRGGGIGQVLNCPPTFGMYQFYGATNDLDVLDFRRDEAFAIDVTAIEELCRRDPRPRLLFLASPNNPDGRLLPEDALQRLLDLPLIVVLDEAYVEFSGQPSRAPLVAERDNLIVLRTFSKWAGLAGLRVGYGVFPQALMPALWRIKSPYNVNGVAQAAALATLEDLVEAQTNIAKIITERQRMMDKLGEISFLQTYPSDANYILCRVNGIEVQSIKQAMEHRGIILRYFGSADLAGFIRISVGTPMQDESALLTLRSLEKEGGNHA
jgi:histidinol-phosphate aminotransferase